MGYYTEFDFSVHDYGNSGTTNGAIASAILDLHKKNEDLFYPLMDELMEYIDDDSRVMSIEASGSTKWYDHDLEMLMLSRQFADVVFKLHGVGEENGDIWDAYYKDGKMCKYRLPRTLPPFNPADLKTIEEIKAQQTDFFNG